jgi:hypothetical protein
MASEILKRDDDRVTVLGGITDDSNQFITQLRVNPSTGRLEVSATIANITTLFHTDTSISTANQTTITSSATMNFVTMLSIGGQVWQPNTATGFTYTGTTVTLTSGIPAGEEIVLVYL